MAINDVLNQLQNLIQGGTPRLIQPADRVKDLLPFLPGERYTAQVQEQVAGGRFLVLIRDQQLDLNLPRNTQPGQNVELRFVSNQPRPTFVLAESGSPAAGTPVRISDGARYLNALLDRVQDLAQQARPAPAADGAVPARSGAAAGPLPTPSAALAKALFEGAPPPTPQFAMALKESVARSGLFYESHQAQWVAGERPLADLLKEPQGRLSEPRAFAQAAAQSPGLGQPPRAEGAPLPLPHSGAQATTAHEPVHPQSAPLVQQQIDALDSRQLIWHGQVWTGQDMQWLIEEREAREPGREEDHEWATRLNLTLPGLGEVNALLQLTPAGLVVNLKASEASAPRLRLAVPELAQGMASAQLNLAQVTVNGDG